MDPLRSLFPKGFVVITGTTSNATETDLIQMVEYTPSL